jgi:hypothetical protein
MKSAPVYDDYEISGCCRLDDAGRPDPDGKAVEPCEDSEAHFWTLYGHITGQGVEAIGDFPTREAAEEVFYRITGEAYGSHKQVAKRLRLMHAAPLLREALEPYAIHAKNRMEWSNGEESEDAIDYIARRAVHAYTAATPRPPGADAVTRQIERLMEAVYFSDWDTNKVCPDFAALTWGYITWMVLGWDNLDRTQQEPMLEKYVDWNGFDHPSSHQVKQNVLDGRPKEEWFAGLDTHRQPGTGRPEEATESGTAAEPGDQQSASGSRTTWWSLAAPQSAAAAPPHPWPSEVAKANRQKPVEQDRGHDQGNGQDKGHSL